MDNETLLNAEDYGLSFSEDVKEKIQAVFADTAAPDIKAFAANVLIGNTAAAKLNEHVGDVFDLTGYHIKNVTYQNGTGRYTTLFGYQDGKLCAYGSSSDKIYTSVMLLTAVYGTPSEWRHRIPVRIRMDTFGNNGKAYRLEVIG